MRVSHVPYWFLRVSSLRKGPQPEVSRSKSHDRTSHSEWELRPVEQGFPQTRSG